MAVKKSELYRSLWESCDELRGSMDASQYKDYVLVLLFIKYVSDRYTGQPFGAITIPEGASFNDMRKLKGKSDIGDRINKEIIKPLFAANKLAINQGADFDDDSKLGTGKAKVERLTNLVAIFEKPELDFSGNGAAGDDILGDAYEYLMRHFAQDSGKSKGQFYTPSEVSRILAGILNMQPEELGAKTTAFDPACGSGSLLLKLAEAADGKIDIYGQENDSATTVLARMNVVLHDMPGALHEIKNGNTLADPKHLEGRHLKQFDFVVANPPFSYKSWTNGVNPDNDPFERFSGYGVPPTKNGDYAWVLHIIKCLKATGRAAVILPHGVLFRGNAEAGIRRAILERGLLAGVIGLPANLFYGTGIPACILLLDRKGATDRSEVFMLDASNSYIKDGNKNRLRERDIHRIVDVFTNRRTEAGYSRSVPVSEIADEQNDYNLNLPRYLDTRQRADDQDIDGHLRGGIPVADIDTLSPYWAVFPNLRTELFEPHRPGYLQLKTDRSQLRPTILAHPEFQSFRQRMRKVFMNWRGRWCNELDKWAMGDNPKDLLHRISEDLLATYADQPLTEPYAVYQHLLDYWNETLQDDLYLISTDGWDQPARQAYRKTKTTKTKGKTKVSDVKGPHGLESKLLPARYLIARFFAEEQAQLDALNADLETATATKNELAEEHGTEDGLLSEPDSLTKTNVNKFLTAIKKDPDMTEERAAAEAFIAACNRESAAKKGIKDLETTIENELPETYANLTDEEVKTLVVEDKWLAHLDAAITAELDRAGQTLANRLTVLSERYADTLPQLSLAADGLEAKVIAHLKNMGYAWK
ncbi:type I restriction-modification system subunit M [Neolewinella aurantiaca]|uniref:site-specific DNA-methyltransferase (adenine-specific) n=1 Tax=Neolewinella aurantiaca TaxID=2602767 RepID=A0A5C7FHV3_9BACT|nr:type I restriction-modification system subunit M [Neolewinella aurantiaca]TXF89323.1 type I restriction-modification system subunit M [Neolewinella aurantiaca]